MHLRIATISQARSFCRSIEGNRGFIATVLESVFAQSPDIVCLPEAFTAKQVPVQSVADVAETVPGPTTEMLSTLAKEHHCYIICPIYTRRADTFRNSAVIIDRSGAIAGIYDKARPAASSGDYTIFEQGVTPGYGAGYFDLDVGRVGVRICMDLHFAEDWKALADLGVKAVFWPSAYDSMLMLQAYAILHGYYIISSVRNGKARIINPCGRIIAETTPLTPYTVSDINLDFIVAYQEFNAAIPDKILEEYAGRVKVDIYQDDGLFLVEPLDDTLTTEYLQKEFGFETTSQSTERYREAYRCVPHNILSE